MTPDEWIFDRPVEFVQTNFSRSLPGVLRGLHYQFARPQAKLVTVVRGAIFDVMVDVRPESPDFGRCYSAELTEANRRQLFIPAGFAHGFCVLGEELADVVYQVSDYYHPASDCGIHWADPALGIPWPVAVPVTSERDRALPHLADVPRERLP